MSGQQFYSEKEVGDIVKRAAELQERSSGEGGSYTPGVSREELSRVAKEMGIATAYLDKALQERLNKTGGEGLSVLGVPLVREYEKVVPGELPPEDFDVVLEEIGPRRKTQFTSQVGRSLQSRVTSGLGHAFMMVSSRDGRTRIRMKSIALFAGLLTLYPMLIFSTALSAHLSEIGTAAWIPPAMFVGALGVGWAAFAYLAKKGHAAIREMMDRIEARIASVTSSQNIPTATTSVDPVEDVETTA